MPDFKTLPVLGGQYPARQNPDNTWDLLGVPVFGEMPAWTRRNPFKVDRFWHEQALQAHRLAEVENYIPPVHLFHHDGPAGKPSRRAGFFRVADVRPAKYKGKLQSTMYVDMLRIPPDIFKRIENGEITFASAEVQDWWNPELASVALLDDEAPHFKFPLITVGVKKLAHARGGDKFSAKKCDFTLFKFRDFEATMNPQPAPAAPAMPGAPAAPAANPMPDWAPEFAKMIARECMAAMRAEAEGSEGEETSGQKPPLVEPGDMEGESEEPEGFATEAADDMPGEDGKTVAKFAALEAEVIGQRNIINGIRNKERLTGRVANAVAKLNGYNVDAETRKSIEKFAAMPVTGGIDPLQEFVTTYQRVSMQDPPESFGAYAQRVNPMPNELQKFSAKGPEAQATARRHWPVYEQLKSQGLATATFEEFVEAQEGAFSSI